MNPLLVSKNELVGVIDGGYPIVYFLDGDYFCWKCATKLFFEEHETEIDFFPHYEGAPIYCDSCNFKICSFYGSEFD